MPTANEKLLDAAIHRAIDTHQFSTGVVRRLIALLNRTDTALFEALANVLARLPKESFTVARLEQLIFSVQDLNAQAYTQIGMNLTEQVRGLAAAEAGYQFRLFSRIIPAQVLSAYPVTAVAIEQVVAGALSRPFQGRLLSEWAKSIGEDRMRRIREAVRIGYVSNETNDQIITRIRGTRAKQYSDGIIDMDRRNLAAIVNTAVSHMAASARDEFYKKNIGLVKARQWVSTLDTLTSNICKVRDSKQYDPITYAPLGHLFPWLGGPGRAHMNCRSIDVAISYSWKELTGVDIARFSPSTRASMDGQVPAEQNYGDWLQKQSAARQDEILGKTRGEAMRAGRLPWDKMYDKKGKWLTLDQLGQRGFKIAP